MAPPDLVPLQQPLEFGFLGQLPVQGLVALAGLLLAQSWKLRPLGMVGLSLRLEQEMWPAGPVAVLVERQLALDFAVVVVVGLA